MNESIMCKKREFSLMNKRRKKKRFDMSFDEKKESHEKKEKKE